MSEHHRGPRYGSIWWWLLGLTIIEVVAATQMPSGTGKLVVLVALAVVKAALVALYFMHLRYDKPFNGIVFVSSLLFVALFLALTLMDVSS